MLNLNYYYSLVENCVRSLGVDPAQCRTDNPGQWDLKKGSAKIWLDIFSSQQNPDYGYFQALAPIVSVPENNKEAFFLELLEINHTLYGMGFTLNKGWIYIRSIREVEGLSESEIMATLNRIGAYADQYDDYLANKYSSGGIATSGGRAPVS